MLGKIEGWRKRGRQRMRWLDSCWQDTALAAVYFPNSCGSKEMLYTLAIGNNYGNYSIEHWDNDVGGRYSLGDSGKSEEVNIYV